MRALIAVAVASLVLTATPAEAAPASVEGVDVTDVAGANVDWSSWWDQGKRFAGIQATAGARANPDFPDLASGAADAGFLVSASHFARPDLSGGAAQADYFVDHGGAWSADGTTLPGTLDLEWNPYGSACYGLSPAGVVAWIKAFGDRYHARTGRWPAIYTATGWWSQCTGNQGDFSATSPLWIASYGGEPGTLPYHWTTYTFWQYGGSGTAGLDRFNGTYDQLKALATG